MPVSHSANPISILLVEDDPDDVEIITRAMQKVDCPNTVHVVSDGEEAWEFLSGTGRYTDHNGKFHHLVVLLDLNIPRLNGWELLRRIKKDPALRRMPVVVLTTSDQQQDVLRCYDIGANTFITKPASFTQFVATMDGVCRYWKDIATCPDRKATIP